MRTNQVTLISTIALLGIAPILIDRMVSAKQRHQDARDDELVKEYECYPLNDCVVDFNRDGIPARFEVVKTHAVGGDLVVVDADKEILRLAYDHTDNTLRTHLAIHTENSESRLLVYDGVSHQTALKAAYRWNGETLVEAKLSGIEQEIVSAMATHDDTGGWNERSVFRPFERMLYLGAYYLLFSVVFAALLYRRFRRSPSGVRDKTRVTNPQSTF